MSKTTPQLRIFRDEGNWWFVYDDANNQYAGNVFKRGPSQFEVRKNNGQAAAYWPIVGTVARPGAAIALLTQNA